MKSQRSTEQFYPKPENENLPSGARQSEESVRSVIFDSSGHLRIQSPAQPSHKTLGTQAGQIVVEYVLMLLVAIGIAVLMTNLIVSRQEGNEGFLIKAWGGIIETISKDPTDEVPPANPGAPGN